MWDYNKLFENGNIVGIKSPEGKIYAIESNAQRRNAGTISRFRNEYLSFDGVDGKHFVVYVVKIDEHGDIIEKVFDRERDMHEAMPKLESGMFVRIIDKEDYSDNTLAYVDIERDRLICQDGDWETVSSVPSWEYFSIVEVYPIEVNSFTCCYPVKAIWRDPEYQAYLDSKNN